ncbi:MAG: N-acetylmuramoyl-L-alanine amidase [Acidobacteria bacterium]|nr:N-acetylmuramoyl-L-alanine amidase [Acidobacteriota bacterium]
MKDIKQQDSAYIKIVDRYSRYIESPVLRLKYLNAVLKTPQPDSLLMKLPLVGSLPERARLIVELSKLLPPSNPMPLALRFTSLLYRLRFAVYAVCVVATLAAASGLVFIASKAISNLSSPTVAKSIDPAETGDALDPSKAVSTIGNEAGLPLDKVWLVEKSESFEEYSNGARILKDFETAGAERKFYRFDLDKVNSDNANFPLQSKPVGIIYHLTESDLLPFSNQYNASLKHSSQALMEYARAHRLYNYIIDRFGRIYRIVRDEGVANHAGNSIWCDGRSVYVNLNSSFLGISFEGKAEAGKGPDGITEAQLYAARVLTAVLRSKYQINDANCTTHGLVSTNPTSRLLGHHTDWVANFPFEAVGLTNKYETEMYAISRFGFAYDQAYVTAAGGKRWAGLSRADSALWETAKKNGVVIEQQRRAFWEVFQRAYAKQHAIDQERLASEEDVKEVSREP